MTATAFVAIDATGAEVHREVFAPKTRGAERLDDVSNWTRALLMRRYAGEFVGDLGVEEFVYGAQSQSSVHEGGAYGWQVRLAVLRAGLAYWEINAAKVKKFATGRGVGTKSVIIKEVFRRWQFDTSSDDEADAYVIARMVRSHALEASGVAMLDAWERKSDREAWYGPKEKTPVRRVEVPVRWMK